MASWHRLTAPNGATLLTADADQIIDSALAGIAVTREPAPRECCGCFQCRRPAEVDAAVYLPAECSPAESTL